MSIQSSIEVSEVEKKVIFHFKAYQDAKIRFIHFQELRGSTPSSEIRDLRDLFNLFLNLSKIVNECRCHSSQQIVNQAIKSGNMTVKPFSDSYQKIFKKMKQFKSQVIDCSKLDISLLKEQMDNLQREIAEQQELLCLFIDINIYNISINTQSFRLSEVNQQRKDFGAAFDPYEMNFNAMLGKMEVLCKQMSLKTSSEKDQKMILNEDQQVKDMNEPISSMIQRIINGYKVILRCFSMQKEALKEILMLTTSNDIDNSFKVLRKVRRQETIYRKIIQDYEKIIKTGIQKQDKKSTNKHIFVLLSIEDMS